MFRLARVVTIAAVAAAVAAPPAAAVQRAFVASSGNDANTASNCTFTNPCRGFTAALSVVDPGGEIVALDAAGYGAVTITKSVTITANPGFYAGISAGSGNGVTIATPGVRVTLRGLNINGVGASRGVSFTSGAGLSIENCLITNFGIEGVFVNTAAAVRITDSTIRDNGWGVVLLGGAVTTVAGTKVMGSANDGLSVSATPAGSTTIASVTDSVFSGNLVGLSVTAPHAATAHAAMSRSMSSNNGKGVLADGGAGSVLVTVGDSLVTGNSVSGLAQAGSATLESRNNIVRQNGIDTSGAITTLASAGSGTVTSVSTGSGLTGGPITTSGTIGLATTQLLPSVACTANQVPKWNGSAWGCADGGTVTGVTASAPLASSGGTAPNITLTGGNAGQVLTGTGSAAAWSGSVTLNGNLTLVNPSTSIAGNIMKGPSRFIHNYGTNNTFIGVTAGNFTMTGSDNTASGMGALLSNTTGSYNTASGTGALYNNTTGVQNTASSMIALYSNTTGNGNTASGHAALFNNTTGDYNTASGTEALFNNTTGYYNTASGNQALRSNMTGVQNTAIGMNALYYTTGSYNTASGTNALFNNTAGYENTATGWYSLHNNTVGNYNTATGDRALGDNVTGDRNTAIGSAALIGVTSGSDNIALGATAGSRLSTGSLNIAIGNEGVAADSGVIRIGASGNQTRTFFAGIRGVTTALNDAIAVVIDSTGQLGTVSSSRRFKDDIADMDAASSALMKLRPVTFHYKVDANPSGRRLQYGLIAEEVMRIYPGLVTHSADGEVETVMYQYLPAMLINEYQKQQRMIDMQSGELARQRRIVAELKQDRDLLKQAVAEIAELKQQTALLTQQLNQQSASAVTASFSTR